ncbi:MAG: hypothetical protein U0841_04090 [Chloroflexia bacterium]
MMTELLYQTDSYLREFEATVVEVADGGMVILGPDGVLSRGWGQPFDLGTLEAGGRSWAVVKVEKRGPVVAHQLEGEGALPEVGTVVRRARLGAAVPADADAHGDACAVRGGLARVWRAGDGRADESGPFADGF